MKASRIWAVPFGIILALAPLSFPQTAPPAKPAQTVPESLTDRDIVRMVQARVYDDVIVSKIKSSKTSFDTSVDALIALRRAGLSDAVLSAMMRAAIDSAGPAVPSQASQAGAATSQTRAPAFQAESVPAGRPAAPAEPSTEHAVSSAERIVAENSVAENSAAAPALSLAAKVLLPAKQTDPSHAPQNYGVYIQVNGELRLLGRIQTKVQLSRFRMIALNRVPFTREKIDINIPGAHSTSRYSVLRPNFYAYLPPSRDVSRFKLLKATITGPKLDQRRVANASVLFSAEEDQDEVPCDIGPTSVKDLYRISPREDLRSGEFSFVEGSAGNKATPDLSIVNVWDFAIDRKEDKLPLAEYLSNLSGPGLSESAFLEWTKEDCQKVIDDRQGKLGISGSVSAWLKEKNETLDVYWADRQFAQAFARLEMLDKDLTPEQTRKLAGLLIPANDGQFYVMVSVGGKIGTRKLNGSNENERTVRPFDAALTNDKGKDLVPASRLEFIGGYSGLWKSTFDQKNIRGQILTQNTGELDFEARLTENLDFKAKFPLSWADAER